MGKFDSALENLYEAYFGDYFPKGFMDFYKKWKKFKNNPNLYVQFTSYQGDVLDKKAYEFPNHSDPMGIYGYPLKYVIDYPADVWYGQGAKYVRVLEDKSKSSITINTLERWHAMSILNRMGLGSESFYFLRKKFPQKAKGSTGDGKIFFQCVQIDLDKSVFRGKYESNDLVIRSAKEQTELFLKAGIDAVKDTSKSIKQAVINDREPNQIIFLKPSSFEVKEVFRLSDVSSDVRVTIDNTNLIKKIAAKISTVLEDTITSDSEREGLGGWTYFWTKGGRLIKIDQIDTSLNYRMKNMKMGQKIHKGFKQYSPYSFKVQIESEKEDISETIYSDEKLEDFLARLASVWYRAKEKEGKFVPYTKQRFKEEQKRERDAALEASIEKELKAAEERWDDVTDSYNFLMDLENLPHMPTNLTRKDKSALSNPRSNLLNAIVRGTDLKGVEVYVNQIHLSPEINTIAKNLNNVREKYKEMIENYGIFTIYSLASTLKNRENKE